MLTGMLPRTPSRASLPLVAAVAAFVAACAAGPVEWSATEVQPSVDADPGWFYARLPAFAGARTCESLAATAVRRDTPVAFAAWWAVRSDSSAVLLVARSEDRGMSWGTPVPVDTLDRGTRACARPAPSMAYDPAGGYVHVAYFLEAPEGPGLFFAHSMDRGRTFHSPVAIVYGERPVEASVSADHDTVAVAYVDPNSARGRVLLAFSRTAGHIFEQKAVAVSGADAQCAQPEVIVRGRTVSVAWREGAGAMRRQGVLRD